MTPTPSADLPFSKGILKLARQIDATRTPEFVPVEADGEFSPERSYDNVAAIVRRRGGSMLKGWILRELPTVFVEANVHAVWRCPDGSLVDVTPRTDGLTRILFVADSKTRWQGEDVEPRRTLLHEQTCYCGSGMPFKICHGQPDE